MKFLGSSRGLHTRAISLRVAIVVMAIVMVMALLPLLVGCGSADGTDSTPGSSSSPSASNSAGHDASASASGTASASSTTTEATTVERLHVDGARLVVNAKNQPRQLRGVSTHGIAWFPQYVNGDLFGWLKQDWGINTVRLSMYTAENGGYATDGDKTQLTDLVCKGIDAAIEHDLYVIVDWHSLSDNNPNTYVNEAKEFFNTISKQYAGKANMLYEICNEPNGNTTWNDVKQYAQQVIPVIRANDPDAIVLVGTPNWDQNIEDAQHDPLDFDNVMYTLHFYANEHGQWLRDKLIQAVEAGTPVFVSEFGTTDASGNGTVNTTASEEWLNLLDKYDVSYVIWSLSNKGESTSLFTTDNSMHPTESDLSEQGRWYRNWLRAHAESSDSSTESTK